MLSGLNLLSSETLGSFGWKFEPFPASMHSLTAKLRVFSKKFIAAVMLLKPSKPRCRIPEHLGLESIIVDCVGNFGASNLQAVEDLLMRQVVGLGKSESNLAQAQVLETFAMSLSPSEYSRASVESSGWG